MTTTVKVTTTVKGNYYTFETANVGYSELDLCRMYPNAYKDVITCGDRKCPCRYDTILKCSNLYKVLFEHNNGLDFMILSSYKDGCKYPFSKLDIENLGEIVECRKCDQCSNLENGSIIRLQDWDLMYNDFCMLGAIDSKKDFIFILKNEEDLFNQDLIWSQNALKKPNTLGRELFMLYHAGYKMAPKSSSREIHFLPPSEDGKIDLEDFSRKYNEISTNEAEFFKVMKAFFANDQFFTK